MKTTSNYFHPAAIRASVSSICCFRHQLPTIRPARIWSFSIFYTPQISQNITPYEPLDRRSVFIHGGLYEYYVHLSEFPKGMVCLQTDDTVYDDNSVFKKLEAEKEKQFDSKDTVVLSRGKSWKFGGGTIHSADINYTITQKNHIEKMVLLNPSNFTSEIAQVAYVSEVYRPDASYVRVISQAIEPEERNLKFIKQGIKICKDMTYNGLKFVPLHLASVTMCVFVDAGSATNKDMSSQIGFLVTLMTKYNNSNIVRYSSLKAKRVTWRVLATELFAMVHSLDVASTICLTLNVMIGLIISLSIYTDSRNL